MAAAAINDFHVIATSEYISLSSRRLTIYQRVAMSLARNCAEVRFYSRSEPTWGRLPGNFRMTNPALRNHSPPVSTYSPWTGRPNSTMELDSASKKQPSHAKRTRGTRQTSRKREERRLPCRGAYNPSSAHPSRVRSHSHVSTGTEYVPVRQGAYSRLVRSGSRIHRSGPNALPRSRFSVGAADNPFSPQPSTTRMSSWMPKTRNSRVTMTRMVLSTHPFFHPCGMCRPLRRKSNVAARNGMKNEPNTP